MAGGRPWTAAEETYLMDKWGTYSIPAIAKNLNRTVNAIKVRAARLHLGPVLMGGDYVTFNKLALAVTGGSKCHTYQMKSWIENRGFPVHTKKVVENSFLIVYLDEFWAWAEQHRSFIDFSSTTATWSRSLAVGRYCLQSLALTLKPSMTWIAI